MRWYDLSGAQRVALEAIAQDSCRRKSTAEGTEARDRIMSGVNEVEAKAEITEGDHPRSTTEISADVRSAIDDLKDVVNAEFTESEDEDEALDLLRRVIDELDARGWRLIPPGVKVRCGAGCACASRRTPRVRKLAVA